MGLRHLARLLFRKFGIGGVMILIGLIGIVFAVRDSAKNMPGAMSGEFKTDLAFTAIGLIGGALALFIRVKRLEKIRAEENEARRAAQAEAERRAKSDPDYYSKPKVSPESVDLVSISNKARDALPLLPCMVLSIKEGSPDVFASKLGGVPYMPKNFIYPVGRQGVYRGKPLRLLCQLNFGQLPPLEGFPDKGILQFFCSCDNDEAVYGLGPEQNGWRVIYHENIITDMSKLKSEDDMPKFDGDFPFEGEFVLSCHGVRQCPPAADDFRFQREFVKAYNSVLGTKLRSIYDDVYEDKFADGYTIEDMYDSLTNTDTCIGGYPDFTQRDPRTAGDNRTVMLFSA